MLKIRMQGTIKDIQWFKRIMDQHEEIKVKTVSEPFTNKGTNQYFRVYAELEKEQKQIREYLNPFFWLSLVDSRKMSAYFRAKGLRQYIIHL